MNDVTSRIMGDPGRRPQSPAEVDAWNADVRRLSKVRVLDNVGTGQVRRSWVVKRAVDTNRPDLIVIADDVAEMLLRAHSSEVVGICDVHGINVGSANSLRKGSSRRGMKMRRRLGIPLPTKERKMIRRALDFGL